MPPNPRPIPRFIADSTQEGIPHGRFAERIAAEFRGACDELAELPEGIKADGEIDWFPERAWGGRVWVPASLRADGPEGTVEIFGHVSYVQPEEGDPTDFRAKADFTDVLAEDNPDWRIDLNDDVIGRWRGENGRAGAVTLVWGRPLVPGAVAATRRNRAGDRRPGSDLQRALHPDRPRRPRGLRRRDLHGDQALEPPGHRAGLGEPLR